MDLINSLTNLGLSEKEAKVYLALLSFDKATAYAVAIRSGLKKPTTYVVLENLVARGFALKIPQKDKHYFIAKSPRECLALAKEKLSEAEEVLPELLAIQKKGEHKASVSYYEGFEGVKEMYNRLLKNMKNKPLTERSFSAFYAHQKHTPEFLQKYWLTLNEEYVKIGLRRKAVTTLHPSIKNYLKKEVQERLGMDLRALPENDYSSNISIEVYDDFTQIISHRYLQGILIENPDIASVMKQIFNLVWKSTAK
jgi:HTH-type transcriptional regulator, sugar sensing transcriptional regulator